MSRVLDQKELAGGRELELSLSGKVAGFLPVILPILFALVLIFSRAKFGYSQFLYEGTLTMLALICYLTASVISVTNLFAKENTLSKLGLITIGLGYSFNFSGWMIRWIEAGEAEGWKEGINGFWRYYPLDTLYALTLGFCCGAALATLCIIRKPKYEFLSALSTPIIAVILTIAILFGNEIRTLMPILDSYWRPIHVTIATVAYGVCLVSFGLSFAYLLKDGIKQEYVAITVLLYGVLIYCTIGMTSGGYSFPTIPIHASYGPQLSFSGVTIPARIALPGTGLLMLLALIGIILLAVAFSVGLRRDDNKLLKTAWFGFRALVILQAVVIGTLIFQIKQQPNLQSNISERDYEALGGWLKTQFDAPVVSNLELGKAWIAEKAPSIAYTLKSNPVEVGALISLLVIFALTAIFAWKKDKLIESLPQLQMIDSLLYKSVSIAFPLLCMLLITGAVWANESWGRYWGWDPKETGALVATMAYAGFLHTRLARGWRGRKSAYFALIGFALVIFTWLGVSFLLPGLHSYAQV